MSSSHPSPLSQTTLGPIGKIRFPDSDLLLLAVGGKNWLWCSVLPRASGVGILTFAPSFQRRLPAIEPLLGILRGAYLHPQTSAEPTLFQWKWKRDGEEGLFIVECLGPSSTIFVTQKEGGESEQIQKIIWRSRGFKGPRQRGLPGSPYSPPPPKNHLSRPLLEGTLLGEEAIKFLRNKWSLLVQRILTQRKRRLERAMKALDREEKLAELFEDGSSIGAALLSSGIPLDIPEKGPLTFPMWTEDGRKMKTLERDRMETPREIANRLFHKARRAQAKRDGIPLRRKVILDQLSALSNQKETLETASLSMLASLLPDAASSTPSAKKPVPLPSGVRKLHLPLGFLSFAGKTGRANHWVTFRWGRGSDWWFHAADYPGSHVVVRNPRRLSDPPMEVLVAAAKEAAMQSKAPSGKIAVQWTQIKFLRPAPGGPPGRVLVAKAHEILVDLEKAR